MLTGKKVFPPEQSIVVVRNAGYTDSSATNQNVLFLFNFQVEARQKSCGWSASCNCGIAIKEGAFYKIFDMCQVDISDTGRLWWQNPQNLVIRKKGLEESQTNGFYTVETTHGSSTTYEVSCLRHAIR